MNKYYSSSRRRTPWTDREGCTSVQSFIDMQVQNLYEERHGKLSSSMEKELFNSVTISQCRHCGSDRIVRNGKTSNGISRYICRCCGKTFTPMTGTLFQDHRIPVDEWIDFCLQLFSDQSFLSISSSNRNSYSTTRYWVAKLALGLCGYDDHIVLEGDVYIDETYYSVIMRDRSTDESGRYKRGLSRDKHCIAIACDDRRTYCVLAGMGKPSQKRINEALKDHIAPGSRIIHDGEKAHAMLIRNLGCDDEVHPTAETKGLSDADNPLDPINRKCAALKRFIRAHSGFNRSYFDQMLRLFSFIVNPPGNPYEKMEIAINRILEIPNSLKFRDIFSNDDVD